MNTDAAARSRECHLYLAEGCHFYPGSTKFCSDNRYYVDVLGPGYIRFSRVWTMFVPRSLKRVLQRSNRSPQPQLIHLENSFNIII
jgi:hypothetical protein